MAEQIKIGDVVRLKSDTMLMTVSVLEGNNAICYWVLCGEIKSYKLPLILLEKIINQEETAEEKIGIGDVVYLKSDSMTMTVSALEMNNAICYWVLEGEIESDKLPLILLKKSH